MIKIADYNDLTHIVNLGEAFHEYGPWRDVEYDRERTANTVADLIDAPNGIVFVTPTGMIGGAITTLYFSQHKVAQELFWFSKGSDGMALLKAFEDWAESLEITTVCLSALTLGEHEDEIMRKLYARRGYTVRERTYIKGIS